jgi:hypothetical protein
MSSTHDALSRDVCFETVSAPFESGDRRFVTVHQCIETSMRGSLPPDLDLAYADLGVIARIRRLIWAAGSNESRERDVEAGNDYHLFGGRTYVGRLRRIEASAYRSMLAAPITLTRHSAVLLAPWTRCQSNAPSPLYIYVFLRKG